MSGTAVNDKQNIIMANNEEHYSDSDLAHISFFFQSPVLQPKTIFLKFLCSVIKVKTVWTQLWHLFRLFRQK